MLTIRAFLSSPTILGGIRVAKLFSFLCCVAVFFLHPLSCVCYLDHFSVYSIIDCLFGFLWHFPNSWYLVLYMSSLVNTRRHITRFSWCGIHMGVSWRCVTYQINISPLWTRCKWMPCVWRMSSHLDELDGLGRFFKEWSFTVFRKANVPTLH